MSSPLPSNTTHISGGGYTTEGPGYTIEVDAVFTFNSTSSADTGFNLYFVLDGNTSDCVFAAPYTCVGGGLGETKIARFRMTNLAQGYRNLDGYIWTNQSTVNLQAIQIFFTRVAA